MRHDQVQKYRCGDRIGNKAGLISIFSFFYDFCRMILGIKATLGASAVVDFKAVSDVKDKSRLVLQAMFLLEL